MTRTLQPFLSCIEPEDEELAGRYAYELAKNPTDPVGCAMRLTLGDMNKAMIMSSRWRSDPVFQEAVRETARTLTAGDKLNDKEELALAVQDKMNAFGGKLWLEAARFYAELQGFIKKDVAPTTNIQNVIVVPDDGKGSDWERLAMSHQRNLKLEAKTINGDSDPEQTQ